MIGSVLPTAIVACLASLGSARSADTILVSPREVTLRGPEAVQQIVVSAASGQDVGLTASFSSADARVATVDATGLVSPKGDGTAAITVRSADQVTAISVTVRDFASPPPVHFANRVVPIFTKLGCNSGGCHGKASGQNGFRLSLLGFEPDLDYETLVSEGRGRRLFPATPERSLLLIKATAQVPHGGGRKLETSSRDYQVLRRWIAGGMASGAAGAPTVAKIVVEPDAAVLARGESRQILATAVYTDETTEDVTRFAQYQSNEPDLLTVTDTGRVAARGLAGQAAVMARYQGKVAVLRATIPTGEVASQSSFVPVNVIDELALKKWRVLGLTPSEQCTDAEFIRRVSLDITGSPPSEAEVKEYVAKVDSGKAAKLVDRLLESPLYAAHFATKWGDILRNKREGNAANQASTYRFHDWIRQSLGRNVSYDQFVPVDLDRDRAA